MSEVICFSLNGKTVELNKENDKAIRAIAPLSELVKGNLSNEALRKVYSIAMQEGEAIEGTLDQLLPAICEPIAKRMGGKVEDMTLAYKAFNDENVLGYHIEADYNTLAQIAAILVNGNHKVLNRPIRGRAYGVVDGPPKSGLLDLFGE